MRGRAADEEPSGSFTVRTAPSSTNSANSTVRNGSAHHTRSLLLRRVRARGRRWETGPPARLDPCRPGIVNVC
ncbi:hypothetical protein [Streptomyces yanii]|uniref:Uncharacterized protein n=1 Tax=Streptomyces yanii TaxID=78510 RepID=A0ABV5R965_9ACTN